MRVPKYTLVFNQEDDKTIKLTKDTKEISVPGKVDTKAFLISLNEVVQKLIDAINMIEFGDGTTRSNILCGFATVTTPANADTEFEVSHSLNRTPVGCWWIRKDKAGDLYFSQNPTTSKLYLKCSSVSCSGTMIII